MSKFGSARPVHDLLNGWYVFRCRRIMWQMIRDVLSGGYRMSLFTAVTLVLAIVYVVFPFDLIPDRIPVAGWIDDAIVLYLALRQLSKETQRYIRHKAMERKNN